MKARWTGYFDRLYQADPPAVKLDARGVTLPIADPPINCDTPYFVETQVVVNRFKWVKHLGFVASMLNSSLHAVMCSACNTDIIPTDWKRGLVDPSGSGRVIAKTATATEG